MMKSVKYKAKQQFVEKTTDMINKSILNNHNSSNEDILNDTSKQNEHNNIEMDPDPTTNLKKTNMIMLKMNENYDGVDLDGVDEDEAVPTDDFDPAENNSTQPTSQQQPSSKVKESKQLHDIKSTSSIILLSNSHKPNSSASSSESGCCLDDENEAQNKNSSDEACSQQQQQKHKDSIDSTASSTKPILSRPSQIILAPPRKVVLNMNSNNIIQKAGSAEDVMNILNYNHDSASISSSSSDSNTSSNRRQISNFFSKMYRKLIAFYHSYFCCYFSSSYNPNNSNNQSNNSVNSQHFNNPCGCFSWLSIFCCCCPLLGAVSLLLTHRSRKLNQKQKYEQAEKYSNYAEKLNIAALIFGVIFYAIAFFMITLVIFMFWRSKNA
jgi:hypothetical protein